MAALLSTRVIAPSLLRLPPPLRSAIYQHAFSRAFATTPPRRSTLAAAVVSGPLGILQGIHSLGISWGLTIPLSALLVRGVFVYYLSVRAGRRAAQLRNNLYPIVHAKVLLQARELAVTHKQQYPDLPAIAWPARVLWTKLRTMWALESDFTKYPMSQLWRNGMNFGLLIAFTEAIRIKCGAKEGLLPFLISHFEVLGKWTTEGFVSAPAQAAGVSPEELLAQRLEAARAMKVYSESVEDPLSPTTNPPPTLPAHDPAPAFDPTLQTEGLPWCPDLTVPDPTHTLSLALFIVMYAPILLRASPWNWFKSPASENQARFANASDLLNTSQRLGVVIALLFAAVSIKMPAAIVLYFTTNMLIAALQRRWLDVTNPLTPPIRPCKRPLRSRPSREWTDK